jgi:hypothetical protein
MPSERDKMLAGELYDPLDPELAAARVRARDLCQDLNATREADEAERRRLLTELFGAGGDEVWMQPPFFCDYGSNILLGERVFFNFNLPSSDPGADVAPFGWAKRPYHLRTFRGREVGRGRSDVLAGGGEARSQVDRPKNPEVPA